MARTFPEFRDMLAGKRDHRRDRPFGRRATLLRDELLRRGAGRRKDVARYVALAAREMDRQRTQKAGHRLRAAGMAGKIIVASIATYRRTKRFIKQTPALWHAFSKARSLAGLLKRRD